MVTAETGMSERAFAYKDFQSWAKLVSARLNTMSSQYGPVIASLKAEAGHKGQEVAKLRKDSAEQGFERLLQITRESGKTSYRPEAASNNPNPEPIPEAQRVSKIQYFLGLFDDFDSTFKEASFGVSGGDIQAADAGRVEEIKENTENSLTELEKFLAEEQVKMSN